VRHAIRYDEELRLLRELYEELAARGLNVCFRDALPGLTVTTDVPGVPLYVFVSESGTDFDWHNAAMRHPVDDPAGAAVRIAAFLRRHRVGD
jgi:8-oxo-dGTP pyrophosphatase MutT (NUDIX family)